MIFHTKFVSIVSAFLLTGVLIYSTYGLQGISLWDSSWFMETFSRFLDPPPSQKKIVTKKPVTIKKYSLESNSDYTFFETLSDTKLGKQVDLQGEIGRTTQTQGVSSVKEKLLSRKTFSPSAQEYSDHLPSEIKTKQTKTSLNFSNSPKKQKSKIEPDSGVFLVQAGSFKVLKRAKIMVKNLREKGYKPFIQKRERKTHNRFWYRVYLGRFNGREEALKMIHLARVQEHLNPILIFRRE